MAELRIVLDKGELGEAQTSARTAGVSFKVEPQPHIIDPITFILVGGAVLAVGKFMVDLIDRSKGGFILDLRPTAKEQARRDKGVPYGWVAVISADGTTVKIETHDAPKDAAERLLSEVISGAFKTGKELADAARKALGAGKVQE